MTEHCSNLNDDAPECMRKGHTLIRPGWYLCAEGHDHIIAPEVCRFLGLPVTRAHIAAVEDEARKYCEEQGTILKVEP